MANYKDLPARVARDLVQASFAYSAIDDILKMERPDWNTVRTNFIGDALPGEWAAAKTNGTAAAVTVATSQLICTAGTDDNGYAGQAFGLFWKGDNGVYFQSIQALDVITGAKLEVGLIDGIADAGAVATKATPTGTADDYCVIILDTDDNAEVDIISAIDTVNTANVENVFTIVAATNFNAEFKAVVDTCPVYINGKHVGTGSLQGGDLISPWIFAQARGASASRIATAEWWFCSGPNGVVAPY